MGVTEGAEQREARSENMSAKRTAETKSSTLLTTRFSLLSTTAFRTGFLGASPRRDGEGSAWVGR